MSFTGVSQGEELINNIESKIEGVEAKINSIQSKIVYIEVLLETPIDEWSRGDKLTYGSDETKAREHLRDKIKHLQDVFKHLLTKETQLRTKETQLRAELMQLRDEIKSLQQAWAAPKGEVITLTSTSILQFLETQMHDNTKFHVAPKLLSSANLAFKLCGREEALKEAANCMKTIAEPVNQTTRVDRKIPVCAGLSGLGKSRMLEEWQKIFDLAEIRGPRLGTLVLYYNGRMPHVIERSMPIEASFSWRLLHRLFVDGNGLNFAEWFSENLPQNGAQLTLRMALKVVCEKAIQMGVSTSEDTLQLFIGVDEYQAIKKVKDIPVGENEELLQNLLNVLGDIMSSPVDGIRIYPMFAGTDLSTISIVNSSRTEILRLPMLLLTPTEVETAVSSVEHGTSLMMYSPVRRHLFYLGGVPRWCFEYISLLLKKINKDILTIEDIDNAFKTIKNLYIELWGKNLNNFDFIKLAAYCVAGVPVNRSFKDVGGMTWSRLEDSSLCLLTEDSEVLIPYAIFHRIQRYSRDQFSGVEACFIECVQELIAKVDALIYDKAPWELWEVFGAYFHALRINAMIIVGRGVITVSELFKGALVIGCDDKVKLSPTKVFESDDKYEDIIGPVIGRKGNSLETRNWLTEGLVVINGENGKGVDIFFALKKNAIGYVVCLDQRERVAGTNLGSAEISNLLSSATIEPTNLGDLYEPVTVVPLLFSSLRSTKVQELTGNNAVVVSYAQTNAYHHGLSSHPASSPCVNVNKDPVTYIKILLTGSTKDVDEVAKSLTGTKRKFESIEQFRAAVQKICPKVDLSTQERIVFS